MEIEEWWGELLELARTEYAMGIWEIVACMRESYLEYYYDECTPEEALEEEWG